MERLKSKNEFASPPENDSRDVDDKEVSQKATNGAEDGEEGSKGGKDDDDQERGGEHLEGETAEETVQRVFASHSDVAGEKEGGGDPGNGTVDNQGERQEGEE